MGVPVRGADRGRGGGGDDEVQRPDLDPLAAAYLSALLDADRGRAVRLVVEAAEGGRPVRELYEDVLAPVQHEVGRLWQHDEITMATEHYCTAVAQLAMSGLYSYVFTTPRNGLRLVATSAQGNLHEIGIRMVSDLFELEGWDTYYLGASTPHEAVVAAVADRDADLLLVSATLPGHVAAVRELVAVVRADERTRDVPVMVGGPPFGDIAAEEVGADAVARGATDGLAHARDLVDGAQ